MYLPNKPCSLEEIFKTNPAPFFDQKRKTEGSYNKPLSVDDFLCGDDDHDANHHFPHDFEIYMNSELHCRRKKIMFGPLNWVFWSREGKPPPPPPPSVDQKLIKKGQSLLSVDQKKLIKKGKRPPPVDQKLIKTGKRRRPTFLRKVPDWAFESPKEKIKSILQKVVSFPGQALVQFWEAIAIGGRSILTTRNQPFVLTTTHGGLCSYRMMSLNYEFHADGESEELRGLPGRVLRHKLPESTPNVRYYSSQEYPQRDPTVQNNVRGSWALPVFDASGLCCVGVLELVTTNMIGFFSSSIIEISRALEVVGMKNLDMWNHCKQNKDKNEALEDSLEEIWKVLGVVCKTHGLPLAQTWVLCRLCNAVVDDGSFSVRCGERVMSRIDAVYRGEEEIFPFSDACALHHLREGQGVVGRAFLSHNLVFCRDITQFSITEYPLAHYACEYGLTGCFAICLQSSYAENNVYVLEFFLPPRNIEGGEPRTFLVPILTTMRQLFQSFKVISGQELGEELYIEVIGFSEDDNLDTFQMSQTARSPNRPKALENEGEMVRLDSSHQHFMEVEAIHIGNNAVSMVEKCNIGITNSQQGIIKTSERQHRKPGTPISLADLQQHFGMKIEDAAKQLGVSRSTLKRVCRKYQISCWPSHKRNKHNLSLSNENDQGAAQEQIQESSQPPIFEPPPKPDIATPASIKPHFMLVQDTSNMTIKAEYGGRLFKFQLPVLSGMVELQQQMAKRLNLKGGSYCARYQDDDNDWIEIACDEDLQDHLHNSRLLGRNTVKISLLPI